MGKGNNPNRSSDSQSNHNKMVKYVADEIVSRGYNVLADHINWTKGSPGEINGYIPDITATGNNSFFILEIETCPTYSDDHTKEQLTAFSKKGTTYIMIPPVCYKEDKAYDPIPEVKQSLKNWGLSSVRVGTCDPFTGKIVYDV